MSGEQMHGVDVEARPEPQERPRRRQSVGSAVVGAVGELLITLGVLLGLFVVWQLWWTDVEAGQVQREVIEDLGWAETETVEATDAEPAAEPLGPPPVMEEPDHLSTFAVLSVPRWGPGYHQPISQGVSRRDVLDRLGLGHYPGTAMPGEVGNFAVAGHRVTYGKPLNRVEELQLGDPLVVQTEDAWYVYRVTETQVVLPDRVEVIAPVPGSPSEEPTTAVMTLTTCHPMFSARERFIVHAELERWQPADAGPPAELGAAAGEGS